MGNRDKQKQGTEEAEAAEEAVARGSGMRRRDAPPVSAPAERSLTRDVHAPGAVANTMILGTGEPAAGYDDPLALIAGCHARIRRQLATMLRLARHLPVHGHDEDAQVAARALLRYFDTAGVLHHEDEEASLLPRVRERAPEAARLDALLRGEHRALARRWRELRPLLSGIAAAQRAVLPPKLVLDLTASYQAHMAIEEDELLPLAGRVLDADAIAAIGREMAARRV